MVLTWENILEAFIKNEKSMTYLKKKIASDKEIFDLKSDVKALLKDILTKDEGNQLLIGFVKEMMKKVEV